MRRGSSTSALGERPRAQRALCGLSGLSGLGGRPGTASRPAPRAPLGGARQPAPPQAAVCFDTLGLRVCC